MIELQNLQDEIGRWHREHFPHCSLTRLVLKLCEEAGELAREHNANYQYREHPTTAELDAVGDIVIVLAAYCDRAGVSLPVIVQSVWDEVSRRSSERVGV